jgi:hypothetical protein
MGRGNRAGRELLRNALAAPNQGYTHLLPYSETCCLFSGICRLSAKGHDRLQQGTALRSANRYNPDALDRQFEVIGSVVEDAEVGWRPHTLAVQGIVCDWLGFHGVCNNAMRSLRSIARLVRVCPLIPSQAMPHGIGKKGGAASLVMGKAVQGDGQFDEFGFD